jgi:hypothetical protein
MSKGIQNAITSIVTRVMREGGCHHEIRVDRIRSVANGYRAKAVVTTADGRHATYRALVAKGGKVTVDRVG